MVSAKINAYMDYELTRKLESFVINALPQQSHQSDFNMLYIANIDTDEDGDGNTYQTKYVTDDTFFVSVSNSLGYIDFRMVKRLHVPGVLESDYDVMSYYPNAYDMPKFANYYEGHEVPDGGGELHFAFCPFGVNKLEMLNGDIIHTYGTGKIRITSAQRGLKGYAQIPKIREILSKDSFKILKLAIYTQWKEYAPRKYTLNLFSPSMKEVSEKVESPIDISDDRIVAYTTNNIVYDEQTGRSYLKDNKNSVLYPVSASIGDTSNLHGIGSMLKVNREGFIDLSSCGSSIGDEFSVHMNVSIESYAPRGTVLFEAAYGITDAGIQTHHITLWLTQKGTIAYNCQYSDEFIDTGVKLEKGIEHSVTFTVENQKYDTEDNDEYVVFIHVNGRQVWPDNRMYTDEEKLYIWRAKEAYRTYNEVCMKLPASHPVNGGVDAKVICAKKLLHESGFITMENLWKVYELYLNRPTKSKADLGEIKIGSEENSTIEKLFIGQDSQKDLVDTEYYLDGQVSEVIVFSPSLGKTEIEKIHLSNATRIRTIKG